MLNGAAALIPWNLRRHRVKTFGELSLQWGHGVDGDGNRRRQAFAVTLR